MDTLPLRPFLCRLVALLLLALPLAGCSASHILNSFVPSDDYKLAANVSYGPDARQKMDIYMPVKPAAKPCTVLFIYGGRWETGDKNLYRFAGEAFASKGCTTAVIDYRHYPAVKYPGFVEDSAKAFVWLHAHAAQYGGDANHMFIVGHSAGAYNAAMVAMHPRFLKEAGGDRRWIRGVIGISGPYDFLPSEDKDIQDMFSTASAAAANPVTYAAPGLPPMLLLHGENDREVYPKNTRHLAARLQAAGSPVQVIIYPDAQHEAIVLSLLHGFRGKIPLLEDATRFIRSH